MQNQRFHVLAAGEATPPILSLPGVRTAIEATAGAAKSLAEVLNEGPLKVKCLEISGSMTQALAGLPANDAAPDTIKAEPIIAGLLAVVASANGMLVSVKAGMEADMMASVDRKIAQKVCAGELHTHADHVSKVEAAKHETHASMMDHMKNFRARMSAMASAKLPTPADEVMNLDEAAFKPRFDTAKIRCAALEPFSGSASLGADRLMALAWNADESSFTTVLETLKESKKTPANPFENSNPGKAGAQRARFIGAGC